MGSSPNKISKNGVLLKWGMGVKHHSFLFFSVFSRMHGIFLDQSWTGWEGSEVQFPLYFIQNKILLVFKEGSESDVGPEGEGVIRGLPGGSSFIYSYP